jgi:hypothetical protein
MDNSDEATRKRIGFLSFGAWHRGVGMTHTGADALQQTVELAVAAEQSACSFSREFRPTGITRRTYLSACCP